MGRTRSAVELVVLVAALVVVGVSVEGAQTKGRSLIQFISIFCAVRKCHEVRSYEPTF